MYVASLTVYLEEKIIWAKCDCCDVHLLCQRKTHSHTPAQIKLQCFLHLSTPPTKNIKLRVFVTHVVANLLPTPRRTQKRKHESTETERVSRLVLFIALLVAFPFPKRLYYIHAYIRRRKWFSYPSTLLYDF